MTDISVQEIIATFQGVQRQPITSSTQSDNFLDTIKKKQHWTLTEFKEFSLAYSLEYMQGLFMDSVSIHAIKKKYNFQLDWIDHFNVLESIKNKKIQSNYLNYYFWGYHNQINEDIYIELMKKPYFNLLKSKSKIKFVQHSLTTDNKSKWINKYFTLNDIQKGLKLVSFSIMHNIDSLMIDKLKQYYNEYENIMSNKIKAKFFYQIVQTGNIPLIAYFYKEKGINKFNNLVLMWHVCADTAQTNTLEILLCLKDLGIVFNKTLLKRIQAHPQWSYMKNTDVVLDFFEKI